MAQKSHGTSFYIGSAATPFQIESAWTVIGGAYASGIGKGIKWSSTDGTVMADGVKQTLKTVADAGDFELSMRHDITDNGQIALKAAASDKANPAYNLKVVADDGRTIDPMTFLISGRVMGYEFGPGNISSLWEAKSKIAMAAKVTELGRSRIAATRGALPWDITGGSAGTYTRGESRVAIQLGRLDVYELRLVYGNFYSNGGGEVIGTNAITVRGSVETAGGTVQATFGGAASMVIQPTDQVVISDPVRIIAGGGISAWARSDVTVASAGQKWPIARYATGAAGDGAYESNAASSQVNNTGALTLPSGGASTPNFVFMPLAVIGRSTAVTPSVLLIGDSIFEGVNDAGVNGIYGFAARGLVAASAGPIPYAKMARQSEDAADVVPYASLRRGMFLDCCNYVICNLGTNDVTNARTLASIQANLLSIWAAATSRGAKVYQVLLLPGTTSTDGFATDANQTHRTGYAPGGLRDQVNTWIISQAGSTLTGYIDCNAVMESSTAPGKWKSGPALTGDGIHPNTAGHAAGATVITTLANTW